MRKRTVVRPIRILAPPSISISTSDVRLSVVDEVLSPHPFPILSTVSNNGGAVAYRVEASIELPSGLRLARGEIADKPIGYLKPGESVSLRWWVTTNVDDTALTVNTTVSSSSTDSRSDTARVAIPDLSQNSSSAMMKC